MTEKENNFYWFTGWQLLILVIWLVYATWTGTVIERLKIENAMLKGQLVEIRARLKNG